MAERIVYLIGAGFSAPLGLPVTNDFLIKSKDQFAADSQQYGYFKEIFKAVDSLGKIKSYFDSELFNIEEILSVLEMQSEMEGSELRDSFLQYIVDVIKYYTPPNEFQSDEKLPGNWESQLFGKAISYNSFGSFVANLFKVTLVRRRPDRMLIRDQFTGSRDSDAELRYAVISLNYDLVLEELAAHLSRNFNLGLSFTTEEGRFDSAWESAPYLAKLHGSVEIGKIVPPTWSKSLHPEILETWRLAYKVLSSATQWRLFGYSLPDADAYVRYLLKTAALEAPNLKTIHVLCRDGGGVESRYDAFVLFPYYRFNGEDILGYLDKLYRVNISGISRDGDRGEVSFDRLEDVHRGRFGP